MGKKSKSSKETEESVTEEQQTMEVAEKGDELTYEDKVELAIPIAQPMAPRKLAKKVLKVAKKGDDIYKLLLYLLLLYCLSVCSSMKIELLVKLIWVVLPW